MTSLVCANKFQPMTVAKIRSTFHKTAKDYSQKTVRPQLNHWTDSTSQ